MSKPDKRCGTCCWGQWQKSDKGRVLTKWAGDCGFVVQLQVVPEAYRVTVNRFKIWQTTGQNCPTWSPKGIAK